jgi:dTDP-4-dehydrorhamnose reductase
MIKNKVVLILGGNSMIGNQLFKYLLKKKIKTFRTLKNIKYRDSLSFQYNPLKNFNAIFEILKKTKPDYIINSIGITKFRNEIKNFKSTIFLNSIYPHKLSFLCFKKKINLIHLSTDCVFSGKNGNYLDNDFPDSDDLYGISKALGEIRGMPNCLTLRTSFIGYTIKNKKSFFEWIINSKTEIQGFKKAIYTGFTTNELSKIIYKIIERRKFLSGLYNVSSYKIDKYQLIKEIIKVFKLRRIKLIVNNKFTCDRSLNSRAFFKKIKHKVPTWNKMIKEIYLERKSEINDIKK